MGQSPDPKDPARSRRKEEPEAAPEADIPTDDGTVEDDMTIERDDLPPSTERG